MNILQKIVEVEFLATVFARVPSMTSFCQQLRTWYCMHDGTFTDADYHNFVETMLFNCRDVEGLRLNLPFQLIGPHCNVATRVLANTIKAFANRPEEDSAPLKTLVLENVTDIAMRCMWMNPVDVLNMINLTRDVEHLVMTLRRHENEPERIRFFAVSLWDFVGHVSKLNSLCLIGMDHDDHPPRGLKQTKHWQMSIHEWEAKALPTWNAPFLPSLTKLELRRVEIIGESFVTMLETYGQSLQELYLNEVYLKTRQSRLENQDSKKVLWVGIPNQRPSPPSENVWIATSLRAVLSHLKICRASFLAYDLFIMDDLHSYPEFDLIDPCGMGRSISQRFVDVIMGIRQPNMPNGEPVEYLHHDFRMDSMLVQSIKERPSHPSVMDYDATAYQRVINTTSEWQRSMDGLFSNCNPTTLDELHYIAETACQGMNEIHRRRNEHNVGGGIGDEYTHNYMMLNNAGANAAAAYGADDGDEIGGEI